MDKLQELTQKLYNEGLSKGQEEGKAIVEKAQAEAAAIVKKAEEDAAAIRAKAEKDAADYKVKVEGDVKMAATQALQATRHDIENLIVAKGVGAEADKALSDGAYLKEIITAVAKNFSATQAQDLSLVLPEKLQKELDPFVTKELAQVVGKGVEVSFSRKIAGGLKIGPKDGSYFISLTDEAFQELIGQYLRPATKKLLFG